MFLIIFFGEWSANVWFVETTNAIIPNKIFLILFNANRHADT